MKSFTFLLLFISLCTAEIGQLLKLIIEGFGEEVSAISFSELDSLQVPLSLGSFKITNIKVENLRNTVDYIEDESQYELTLQFPSPKAAIEINGGYLNPEVLIDNLQLILSISHDLKKCNNVYFGWGKLSIDAGLLTSLLPDKLLNNDYLTQMMEKLSLILKEKIDKLLKNNPLQFIQKKKEIKVSLKSLISQKQEQFIIDDL